MQRPNYLHCRVRILNPKPLIDPPLTLSLTRHRLSTVMRADKILVFKDSTIVEEGSHTELIKKRGKYHDLWSKQTFYGQPEDSASSEAQSQSLEQSAEQEQDPEQIANEAQSHEHSLEQAESSEQAANQLPSPKKPEAIATKITETSSSVKSENTKPVETSEVSVIESGDDSDTDQNTEPKIKC